MDRLAGAGLVNEPCKALAELSAHQEGCHGNLVSIRDGVKHLLYGCLRTRRVLRRRDLGVEPLVVLHVERSAQRRGSDRGTLLQPLDIQLEGGWWSSQALHETARDRSHRARVRFDERPQVVVRAHHQQVRIRGQRRLRKVLGVRGQEDVALTVDGSRQHVTVVQIGHRQRVN